MYGLNEKNFSFKSTKKYSFNENRNRDEIIKYCEKLVFSNKLEKSTLNQIISLFVKNYDCLECKKCILDSDDVLSCEQCFQIYHLQCLNKKSKLNQQKFKLECKKCNLSKCFNKIPEYNCYCTRFYEEHQNPLFNPELIPHGCGTKCDKIICIHLNCSLPCHPGPHEICDKFVNDQCFCGKIKKVYMCGKQLKINSCENKCEKLMDCMHNCSSKCHKGICFCGVCEIKLNKKKDNTTIINLKGQIKKYGESCQLDPDVVYCGRSVSFYWNLKQSIWANPFKIKDYKDINDVLINYEKYARSNKQIMENLNLLVGKKLACWCDPEPCHTRILIKLMKEKGLI